MSLFYYWFSFGKYKYVFFLKIFAFIFVYHKNNKYAVVSNIFKGDMKNSFKYIEISQTSEHNVLISDYFRTIRPITVKHENNAEHTAKGVLNNNHEYAEVSKTFEHNAAPVLKSEYFRTKRHIAVKHDINVRHKTKEELKYILQWTRANSMPFVYMGVGQQGFIDSKCTYTNCYVTSDRNFFPNITAFDVIAFAGTELTDFSLPALRAPHQKYVFANIESSATYPVRARVFDGYFNWTWTYKLDSDSRWGYLVVRDLKDTIIGPNQIMHWIKHEDMQPAVTEDLKKILRGKTKTAAWFVSTCSTKSKSKTVVKKLQKILESKYNTTVDVYGRCGQFKCSRNHETECDKMLRRDYFFYLSFENSVSEDYVTEKLVRPLKFNTLPIVYGGANYSRFLPERSYINARSLSYEDLADKMHALMNNFDEYVEYFRWTNHYYYHHRNQSPQTNDYCSMCALLNDEKRMKEKTVYENFRQWWNQPYKYFN